MARECHYLTEAEKNALLTANPSYSVVSGPHDTEEECVAVCEAATGTGTTIVPGVEVACCPGVQLPFNMRFTFALTGCTGSFPAQWDPINRWYKCEVILPACPTVTFYLTCQEGAWYLSGAKNAVGTLVSCDPLLITFAITGSSFSFARGRNLHICGCGDGTITVTE